MHSILSRIASISLFLAATISTTASPLLDSIGSGKRIFIAHRGVNLRSTIAGENSLEAIRLAKKSGFDAIETDVRLSADDSLVVMHDATLNRTCLTSSGEKIESETPVASLTWKQLQNDYKLKADSRANQSKIPSLREYLEECRRQGLLVFIEPKLTDETGRYYQRIISEADAVFGRGNYIVTSNNRANEIIRDSLSITDVPLMGILYQTTFDNINRLGNVIMAISTTRFTPENYAANVALSKQKNLLCESHSDRFPQFNIINLNDINVVSTDFLAPDNSDGGETLLTVSDTEIKPDSQLTLNYGDEKVGFGGLYLDFDIEGEAEIKLGNQKFKSTDATSGKGRHQVMIYNATPQFSVKPVNGSIKVKNVRLRLIKY